MKIFIHIFIAATVLAAVVVLGSRHIVAQEAAYGKYELCVEAQYHTTPAAYYQEHGVAPECH